MTPTERKRLQRDREKAGLALLSMWVPRDKMDVIRDRVNVMADDSYVFLKPWAGNFDAGTVTVSCAIVEEGDTE